MRNGVLKSSEAARVHPAAVKRAEPRGRPHQERGCLSTAMWGTYGRVCREAKYSMCPQELNVPLTRQNPVGTAGFRGRGVSEHRAHTVTGGR